MRMNNDEYTDMLERIAEIKGERRCRECRRITPPNRQSKRYLLDNLIVCIDCEPAALLKDEEVREKVAAIVAASKKAAAEYTGPEEPYRPDMLPAPEGEHERSMIRLGIPLPSPRKIF